MYKVIKDKGHNMVVTLQNTDTKESIIIGRLSMDILATLEKNDYTFGTGEDDIKLSDKWDLDINKDVAKELSKKAMKMHKPERDQKKKPSEQVQEEEVKPKKQPVDVFNLIFGIEN